jgi:hypothetical protein
MDPTGKGALEEQQQNKVACNKNLSSILESSESEQKEAVNMTFPLQNLVSLRPNKDRAVNDHDVLPPEIKKSDLHPFSVEEDSEANQLFVSILPVGRTVSVAEFSENGDEDHLDDADKIEDLATLDEAGRSEATTALQIFPIDPNFKDAAATAPPKAAATRPLSSMRAAATLTLKNPISNISSAVLSKARVSPESSILVTPAKRALRADLLSKGKLKRQRLKKVHFQLPKGSQRRVSVRSLNPNMQFVQRWLKFMVLPLSYEVWAFPYRLALGYPTLNPHDSYTTFQSDALCDAAFAVDMVISLATAIALPGRDEFVTSFGEISKHYFRATFPFQVLPSVLFWIATSICASAFATVCPEAAASGDALRRGGGGAGWAGAEAEALGDVRWRCVVDSQHWSVWVWWASTVPRLVPRFLRLRSYFKSMERNLVPPRPARRAHPPAAFAAPLRQPLACCCVAA